MNAYEQADDVDLDRRFSGVTRLYGAGAVGRFRAARVVVVGIGGVGSWAAEALARSAVGHLTLVDLDHIAESNTNRQIHALGDAYGKAKVDAMAERIRAINPACTVRPVDEFAAVDNASSLIEGADVVLDCIDQVVAKAALIAAREGGRRRHRDLRRRGRAVRSHARPLRRSRATERRPAARQGAPQAPPRPRVPARRARRQGRPAVRRHRRVLGRAAATARPGVRRRRQAGRGCCAGLRRVRIDRGGDRDDGLRGGRRRRLEAVSAAARGPR